MTKIIATDLDRTLLPNGSHALSKGAYARLARELQKNKVQLVYVSGRYERLLYDAMKRWPLPKPAMVVGNVGTSVYSYKNGNLIEDQVWKKKLAADWKSLRRDDIADILKPIKELRQQEMIKLNEFKQSYYVSVSVDSKKLVARIDKLLKAQKVRAEIIYSVDVNRNIGLVDIQPKSGTKITALRYVLKKLKASTSNVLYAGDSGNDLLALTSGYNAVLVKNASDKVKDELLRITKRKKISKKVYIAQGDFEGLNGNYVSGIIEGAYHFNFFRK